MTPQWENDLRQFIPHMFEDDHPEMPESVLAVLRSRQLESTTRHEFTGAVLRFMLHYGLAMIADLAPIARDDIHEQLESGTPQYGQLAVMLEVARPFYHGATDEAIIQAYTLTIMLQPVITTPGVGPAPLPLATGQALARWARINQQHERHCPQQNAAYLSDMVEKLSE